MRVMQSLTVSWHGPRKSYELDAGLSLFIIIIIGAPSGDIESDLSSAVQSLVTSLGLVIPTGHPAEAHGWLAMKLQVPPHHRHLPELPGLLFWPVW